MTGLSGTHEKMWVGLSKAEHGAVQLASNSLARLETA